MLISEFARATGLTPDTVRFYVRRGLLTPKTGGKGGSNPYQIFTAEHVEIARMIRMAQSLGFSLKEIAAFSEEYRAGALTPARNAEIMRAQLGKLEEKAGQIAGMIAYVRAKVAWLEAGGEGAEPTFGDYACALTPHAASPPSVKTNRRSPARAAAQ
jgi:DNA-binding transcriptional MerR regulator